MSFPPSLTLDEWKAWVMVTSASATLAVPPLPMPTTLARPFDSSHRLSSKMATTAGVCWRARSSASPTWSPWPWVRRMASTRGCFFSFSGQSGLPFRKGSISSTLPEAVVMRNALWPSQVILLPRVFSMTTILPLEQADSTTTRRRRGRAHPPNTQRAGMGPSQRQGMGKLILRRGREQLLDRRDERFARLLAHNLSGETSVCRVEKRCGERARPLRVHLVDELLFLPRLLAVVDEHWLGFGDEAQGQNLFRVVVQVHAEDGEALRFVLAGQPVDHRIFVAAGLAPGGPEGHHQ